MRAATAIVAFYLACTTIAVLVGWRIAVLRRRYDNRRAVLDEAERIVRTEQSRLRHPSQWTGGL